jgi:hypothetical protein
MAFVFLHRARLITYVYSLFLSYFTKLHYMSIGCRQIAKTRPSTTVLKMVANASGDTADEVFFYCDTGSSIGYQICANQLVLAPE